MIVVTLLIIMWFHITREITLEVNLRHSIAHQLLHSLQNGENFSIFISDGKLFLLDVLWMMCP